MDKTGQEGCDGNQGNLIINSDDTQTSVVAYTREMY